MKRNKFSLSYTRLSSFDMGLLVPCGLTEVLPGDTFQHSVAALIRTQPLLAPIMHPVSVRFHHWFVPHRLVWEEWENFITGGPNGTSTPSLPWRSLPTGAAVKSLYDHYGLPLGGTNVIINMLAIRGYNLIFNEFYRDEDLVSALAMSVASGNDTTTNDAIANVAWEKDYFTSARPWEQKGPSITIPIGTTAPVVTTNSDINVRTVADVTTRQLVGRGAAGNEVIASGAVLGANSNLRWVNPTGLQADLTGASSVTVTALRQALALQRIQEARARYGSRYVEYLRYLGIRSSDARMQRPEYLGGGKQTIQFSEVLTTAQAGTDPVGTMKGHGITAMRSNQYRRFFEEHGYIHTFVSIRPKAMYMDGIQKTWIKRTKEDFWQPELQHIGQQTLQNREVYVAHATPEGTFGYQNRYEEYRRSMSSVSGEFKTSTLNHWHMARSFGSTPALNGSFVTCVPTERTFPVPLQDIIYMMARHNIKARRLVAAQANSFIM